MNDKDIATLESVASPTSIDIGRPVEWMVDPERPDLILGVTYAFAETGARKTVWYTPNKRRAKVYVVVTELSDAGAVPVEP
jgi:hypothetical protein